MPKITYNPKTESWQLLYKDPAKLNTHRWPYTRKSVKDVLYPVLSAAEKARRRQEMLLYALRLSRAELVPRADVAIPAETYLSSLEKVCRSTHAATIQNSRVAVERFRDFLAAQYSGICMHNITTAVAEAFFRSQSRLSLGTLNKYRVTLNYVMRRLIQEREETGTSLPYRNPFATLDLAEIKSAAAVPLKRSFNLAQVRRLIQPDAAFPEQEHVWYLLYMTGWRLSDILNLRWGQINWRQRTLQVTHRKTARYGTSTIIRLTETMLQHLRSMKEHAAPESAQLFPQWADAHRELDGSNRNELRFIRAANRRLNTLGMGGGLRRNCRFCRFYSAHSMRSTVITLLKEHNFNTERIMYLCGHRGGSLEAYAYNRFHEHPRAATEDMLHCLEKLLR